MKPWQLINYFSFFALCICTENTQIVNVLSIQQPITLLSTINHCYMYNEDIRKIFTDIGYYYFDVQQMWHLIKNLDVRLSFVTYFTLTRIAKAKNWTKKLLYIEKLGKIHLFFFFCSQHLHYISAISECLLFSQTYSIAFFHK